MIRRGFSTQVRHEDGGKLHREGEPALILYDYAGRIARKEWWVRGEFKKSIDYDEDGSVIMTLISIEYCCQTEDCE